MRTISLHNKQFKSHISDEAIEAAILNVSNQINRDYKGKMPLFLGILNGSFLFVADLMRKIDLECEISFLKISSYSGTSTTGTIKELVGLNEDVSGRDLIILEDIVDTGITIDSIFKSLLGMGANSIEVATLLFKPDSYQMDYPIKYAALEVGNEFLVGYGLDYDGLGRNLKDIYIINED